jgi:Cft2 family RNA processing exonuclease
MYSNPNIITPSTGMNINPQPGQRIINLNSQLTQRVDINGETLEITPLGSGSEVGRSCVIMKFAGKNIMFDCGIHPAYSGLGSLPYFDEIDITKIDILLITHFHLDHCGALPYFLEKTGFQGECYMTHPTKAIYKLILADYVKVSHANTEEALYEERDLIKSLEKIKLIDYHQEITTKDVKFWAYNAGHVLGAAMFLVEIQGIRVLYTGDFSREIDRHLKPAEIPNFDVHILIVESTYGIHKHEPRFDREGDFTRYVSEIVRRGGKCLLPVFAVGRAQELLLILDEFWEMNPDLQNVDIYYASSLASNCIEIFKTYINVAGDYVKNKFYEENQNPFNFKHITCVKTFDDLSESKPCVVFASPGMLQSGLSRNLFEKWCQDSKNGIVITGYCVEGTLARYLLGEPSEVKLSDGRIVPLKMTVKNVTFSAHSDFSHTSEFIEKLQPKNIVLVHGDGKEMERLRNELERFKIDNEKFKIFKPKIYNPKNCQRIEFFFKIQKNSFIVGNLSDQIIRVISDPLNFRVKSISDNESLQKEKFLENKTVMTQTIAETREDNLTSTNMILDEDMELEEENFIQCKGILLEKENLVLEKNDLNEFSGLSLKHFKQVLSINYTHCKNVLLLTLHDFFKGINIISPNIFNVDEKVKLSIFDNRVVLEWYSSGPNDILADSIAMLIYQLQNYPSSEIFSHYSNKEALCSYKLKTLVHYLRAKYDNVDFTENKLTIQSNGKLCEINNLQHIENLDISMINGNDEKLLDKVKYDLEYFKTL